MSHAPDTSYALIPLLCDSLHLYVRTFLPHPTSLARAAAKSAILAYQSRRCKLDLEHIQSKMDLVVERHTWSLSADWIQELEQEFGELLTREQELLDYRAVCIAAVEPIGTKHLYYSHPACALSYYPNMP